MSLLQTKLYLPHPHSDLLERPRLSSKLDEGLGRKLVLVSAPAGFGKTTLISSWATRIKIPVAWLSLDEHDNTPLRFWTYLIAALQTLPLEESKKSQFGKLSLIMLQAEQAPPIESAVIELLNDISALKTDFVLILDDYHNINNRAIHDGMAFLIDNLPNQIHVIIGSRSEPPLPLSRWRVRRELIEISVDQIRFTTDEAEAFLNLVMGLTLQTDDVTALEKLTEGWVAALQLAAISMQGTDNGHDFIQSFSGDNRYIFDYFAQEVLNNQTDETKHFLLETSLLESLNGPLCNAVTRLQDSHKKLEMLEHVRLFIMPLDQKRQWYRYHRLFADFLQSQLKQKKNRAFISELHRRAGAWYKENNFITEAVNHTLYAEDFDSSACLIKRAALTMFPESEIVSLLQWLKALPMNTVSKDVELSLEFAWALLATVQMDEVEPHLRDIERILGIKATTYVNYDLDPATRVIAGQILCIRANIASHHCDFRQALKLSKQAENILAGGPDNGLEQPQRHFLGLVRFNMALAYELSGEITKASQAFSETMALEQETQNPHIFPMAGGHLAQMEIIQGHLLAAELIYLQTLNRVSGLSHVTPLAGMLCTGLGDIYYEWNELEKASSYFSQGIEMGRVWNNWETLLPGYIGLVRLEIAAGNMDKALSMLDELESYRRLPFHTYIKNHWSPAEDPSQIINPTKENINPRTIPIKE